MPREVFLLKLMIKFQTMTEQLSNPFLAAEPLDDNTPTLNGPPTQMPTLEYFFLPDDFLPSPDIDGATLLQLAEEYANDTVTTATHALPNKLELTEIQQAIKELWGQIDTLYDFVKPQTIEIHNFHCLKVNVAVGTIKEKVNSLFFDALIPLNWKLSVTWAESNTEVDSVTLTMINHHVKQKTVEKLTKYFNRMYNNSVYI